MVTVKYKEDLTEHFNTFPNEKKKKKNNNHTACISSPAAFLTLPL